MYQKPGEPQQRQKEKDCYKQWHTTKQTFPGMRRERLEEWTELRCQREQGMRREQLEEWTESCAARESKAWGESSWRSEQRAVLPERARHKESAVGGVNRELRCQREQSMRREQLEEWTESCAARENKAWGESSWRSEQRVQGTRREQIKLTIIMIQLLYVSKIVDLFQHICWIHKARYSTMADYVSVSCSLCVSVGISFNLFSAPFLQPSVSLLQLSWFLSHPAYLFFLVCSSGRSFSAQHFLILNT